MSGIIGIKIANGDFYPITEENSTAKKRLVLTTVHDRQNSLQINLYRSISKSMLDAQYIGSLIIEKIRPLPKGEPSIEMIISSDIDGNITADAYDLDPMISGQHYSLNVSLKKLDLENNSFDDFGLDDISDSSSTSLYKEPEKEKKDEQKKFPWLIMGLAALFVIIAIAILWFFFLGGRDTTVIKNIYNSFHDRQVREQPLFDRDVSIPPPPPVVQQVPPPPVYTPPNPPVTPPPVSEPVTPTVTPPVTPPATPSAPPPVITAPTTPPVQTPPADPDVQRTRPPAPVSSYRVPAVIPPNGVVYQIRWGDTLWDISEAFYRSPWHYQKIARDNRITNPDHIITGSNVRIYPLN